MTANDLLRRLRHALGMNASGIAALCSRAGYEIRPADVKRLLRREEEEGFEPCDSRVIEAFLDGLIIERRGPRDGGSAAPAAVLTNNIVIRKLRIALELDETGMLAVFRSAGTAVSRAELSALFRGAGQRNYKECGDQLLRNFLRGLYAERTTDGAAESTDGAGVPESSPGGSAGRCSGKGMAAAVSPGGMNEKDR